MKLRGSLLILLFLFQSPAFAQWNRVIAYGDTGITGKCFDGYIDAAGNQIFVYTDNSNNNLSVASFDPWQAKNWSYTSSRNVSGETHVQQLMDGNYLIAYNEMYSGGLLKMSPAGNVIWQKNYLGFVFEALLEETNGDLYACGAYYAYGMIACLDDTGGVRWIKKNEQSMLYLDMIYTLDGHLALTGSRIGPNWETAFVFTKLSKQGNEIWTRNYTYAEGIAVRGLVQSPHDHCFYMAGSLWPSNDPVLGARIMYMKADSSGNVLGVRAMGYVYGNNGHDIVKTEGNNFILAGSSRPQEICGGTNLTFVKFNANLDTVMTRRYGDAAGNDMTVYQFKKHAPNANYLFLHAATWSVFDYTDVVLARIDTMLYLPCDNLYFPMTKTEVVFTSYTGSTFTIDSVTIGSAMNLVPRDMHAADACSGALLDVTSYERGELQFGPNPASDYITLYNVAPDACYEIYDALGKRVLQGQIGGSTIGVADLSEGIYLLVITEGNRREVSKVLIE